MSLPIISVAQMREWERATWETGQTEQAVITRVGEALEQPTRKMNQRNGLTLILAGKGHNGDDAHALASHLASTRAQVLEITDPVAGLEALSLSVCNEKPALIVDGLFGVGLNRPLDERWQEFIARVNDLRCPILAIDVPSGLNADTGDAMPTAIRATATFTVGAPKRGMFSSSAAEYVGQLHVLADVGLIPFPRVSEVQWTQESDFADFPPTRPASGHKGTFGHAALVAGSMGYHGASVLAARGAQRARPGLVTLFTQPDIYTPVAGQLQAAMVQRWSEGIDFAKFSAVLFGPGLAAESLSGGLRETFRRMWKDAAIPVIADASALDWLEPTDALPHCRVITPHPGEAARLLKCSTAEIQRDRVAALRTLSERCGGCWVVLKGQHTVIGRAEGAVFVNGSGNSGLGQGGTGDLLAGFITGWLAQPACQDNALLALRYAVWEHGAAADRLNDRRKNWIVEELSEELGG